MGVLVGAHLNPGVTLANCVFRKHPWRKLPKYVLAQALGAMCAAGVVYGNYLSAINAFEGGPSLRTVPGFSETASAGIFCTYPAPFMTKAGQFFDEFIGSSLLMFLIYALQDNGNIGAGNLTPLGLFFIVFGIGACFGWQTGYAINPARDFGPRLMSYFLGYGHEVWSAGNYYFWVGRNLRNTTDWTRTNGSSLFTGTNGRTPAWLCVWRMAVRHVPIHWSEPHQFEMDGIGKGCDAQPKELVKYLQCVIVLPRTLPNSMEKSIAYSHLGGLVRHYH